MDELVGLDELEVGDDIGMVEEVEGGDTDKVESGAMDEIGIMEEFRGDGGIIDSVTDADDAVVEIEELWIGAGSR